MPSTPDNTEDFFISQISDATGEDIDNSGGEDESPAQVQQTQENAGATESEGAPPVRRDQAQSGQRNANNSTNAQAGKPRTQGRQDHIPGVRDDGKGNLVNAQGQIIVRAGEERRALQTWVNNTRGQLNNAMRRVADLEKENTRLNGIVQGVTAHGLKPEQLQEGISFIRAWTADPARTLKGLLTYARQKGIQVDGIANSAIDIDALVGRIKQEMAPVLNQATANQQQIERQQAVNQEIENFLSERSDARIHLPHIMYLLKPDQYGNARARSLEGAYWQLKAFAQTHGLDWTQPLEPQFEAKVNNQNQNNGSAPRTPPAGGRNQANLTAVSGKSKPASDSWDSIIRAAMAESAGTGV